MTLCHRFSTGKTDYTRLFAGLSLMSPGFQLRDAHLDQQESWSGFCWWHFWGGWCAVELSKCSCTKHPCTCSSQLFSVQSSEMLGSHISVSGSASACLACFTLSHPLNTRGTVCSPQVQNHWQIHQQGTPAGLGKGVCWEQWRHTGDPVSSALAELSAHLSRLQFQSHHFSAFPGVFAPWPKAQQ